MTSGIFSRAADLAQRGVVLGLLSVFGFQVYQIARNTSSGVRDHPVMHSTYFEDVTQKVKEEYQKDNRVDKRDWYEAEDDSYLKNQVRANITAPEFKKKYEQEKQQQQQ